MSRSQWNLMLDVLLKADVTLAGHRLALAVARYTLGYPNNRHRVGRDLLRAAAAMDGRTFDRALAELVGKGLLRHEPGTVGRGNRGRFELVFETGPGDRGSSSTAWPPEPMLAPQAEETAAPERRNGDGETAAPERRKPGTVKRRAHGRKNAAPQRRRSKRKVIATPQPEKTDLSRRAFDAYQQAGGTIKLDRERQALAGSVKTLERAGTPENIILAACKDLGRHQEFPGLLKQRAATIAKDGGPCKWHGHRTGLTATQLRECGCPRCLEWANELQPI